MQQYQLSLMERILRKVTEAHQLCLAQTPDGVTGLIDDAGAYFRELHATIPQHPHVRPQIQLRLPLSVPRRPPLTPRPDERPEPLPRWVRWGAQ
jgi:hypothetical protein